MRKFIPLACLAILLFFSGTSPAAPEPAPGLVIDGESMEFDDFTGIPYISAGGRTMMPVRVCLNAIGCEVDWLQESQTVIARKAGTEMILPIGAAAMLVQQKPVDLDTAAIIKNGRTYLPLRAVLEAFGYAVEWDAAARSVIATELRPDTINGGSTGIFARRQLHFSGFDGIQADITLPLVELAEKGDCPYVYFGFDWENDAGNAEGGFQFIEDSNHPVYLNWTAFMRQGDDWRWSEPAIALEPGSSHHLKFYAQTIAPGQSDLVMELDGQEIIRKQSPAADFAQTSAKAVCSMAMLRVFDGKNCLSRSEGAKIENLMVSPTGSEDYEDFYQYELYCDWRPYIGDRGMWYGSVDCIPSYLHYGEDGSISIYPLGGQDPLR